ncbi:Hypothetical_protein [Hexamita inflata]|uniref:Hypothetical_protein n=1 Tax=Hexamita inflata TaxID=28002 RepID=A0AA86UFI9_9EUKA|nr:Hypothetical protein HINF_LOCUS36887 [Hexamita inflata]
MKLKATNYIKLLRSIEYLTFTRLYKMLVCGTQLIKLCDNFCSVSVFTLIDFDNLLNVKTQMQYRQVSSDTSISVLETEVLKRYYFFTVLKFGVSRKRLLKWLLYSSLLCYNAGLQKYLVKYKLCRKFTIVSLARLQF